MPHSLSTRIAIHGQYLPFLTGAITAAGGTPVGADEQPVGLVLDHGNDKKGLLGVLDATPSIRWVQLPSAGVEAYAAAMAAHPDKIWTSAKGAYAKPVAEHALALTLALLRNLPERAAARSWGAPAGTSLHGLTATIVGAGGVGLEILRLFEAFDMQVDVVRRRPLPVPGARHTRTAEHLGELLPQADVVVIAAALTGDSIKLIGAKEFRVMKPESILVNVARGGLVDTSALAEALAQQRIRGAGLDVTDPEPLPIGHPLWQEPRALITPHTADTLEMIRPLLADRVGTNVRRFRDGEELEGLVDPKTGY
ncbi:hydroxyacid dehydrogenase [Paenarthrobacter nitroguajacolicus]|uniref:D-isomer specific 2-hydroxyacid dehydrogenase family protein n=1 Tax=Paenarthrobacter nitroguajacolicus TaxID=211146 RepID=UPI0015BE670D|nr:D-isomer specific 2-hydroxyacid dehydrogenase family protein [Paenarthrobacter nitroguajacolicus]NWL10318.1 hydroxyacid dehydrogenase [Paenarthrobacter nitroguajacolicus]